MTARDPAVLPMPQRLIGKPASPGLVFGRIAEIAPTPARGGRSRAGPPGERLAAAIAEAVQQLEALRSGTADADARKILEFQIEFLNTRRCSNRLRDSLPKVWMRATPGAARLTRRSRTLKRPAMIISVTVSATCATCARACWQS